MNLQSLAQDYKIVTALYPQVGNGATLTAQFISCKNLHKVFIIVNVQRGNATSSLLTLQQATSVAAGTATGATGLASTATCRIWVNAAIATNDVLVETTAAISYTIAMASVTTNEQVVIEFDPSKFSSGYSCLGFTLGTTNASNLFSAVYVGVSRYRGAADLDVSTS